MSKEQALEQEAFNDFLHDQIACVRFIVSTQVVKCKLTTLDGNVFWGVAKPLQKALDAEELKRTAYRRAYKRLYKHRLCILDF